MFISVITYPSLLKNGGIRKTKIENRTARIIPENKELRGEGNKFVELHIFLYNSTFLFFMRINLY